MGTSPVVTRVVVDFRGNALVLELDAPLPAAGSGTATIDIGTNGRLEGVEIGTSWLAIAGTSSAEAHLSRTATIEVDIAGDRRSLRIPRRGNGWEISFPSGNQCWIRDDGSTLCSVVGA
ncbi:MAG TPA: hypothetical protein VD767_07965 [Thermomicrobiales bacterium]|nr:hypothetical protein [Thermomicrobiales bacterium]